MLKVSLHSSVLAEATAANKMGWLDIAYKRLAGLADYRAVLFMQGQGTVAEATITDYPRWSGSVFDLVARAIAVALQRKEELPAPPAQRRCAYARVMSLAVEHVGVAGPVPKRRLGTLDIRMTRRGRYEAVMQEDIFGHRTASAILYAPKVLIAWQLAAYAIAHCLTGMPALPARPPLALPPTREREGKPAIALQSLPQPARTGFLRWLRGVRQYKDLDGSADALDVVPADEYARFLREAV